MMPVVRINDATFADLKSIATWFGAKTPGEAIDRIVQETMEKLGMERDDTSDAVATTTSTGAMEFTGTPGLSFTKPQAANINGQIIDNPRWANILLTVIAAVKAKGFEGDKLVDQLYVPAKAGKYANDGFRYHADLGISVQGQSASDAWRETERLAKEHGISVVVEFRWRHNPKAQFPGREGVLKAGF